MKTGCRKSLKHAVLKVEYFGAKLSHTSSRFHWIHPQSICWVQYRVTRWFRSHFLPVQWPAGRGPTTARRRTSRVPIAFRPAHREQQLPNHLSTKHFGRKIRRVLELGLGLGICVMSFGGILKTLFFNRHFKPIRTDKPVVLP